MKLAKGSDQKIIEAAYQGCRLGQPMLWLDGKAPNRKGWPYGEPQGIKALFSSYRPGNNLGLRLAWPFKGGFIACVDLDVRSPDPRHLSEAYAVIDGFMPGLRDTAAVCLTGRGNGSAHFFHLVDEPSPSANLGRSSEMVKVYSPSSEPSRTQVEKLSIEDLADGYRLKAAWEVDFMCVGKQCVLPPSIHPDTKKRYRWLKGRALF